MVRLMLVLGLVLSLAACSGGTDGLSKGEEADLQDRLEAAEAERIKAEEATRKAEEATRIAEEATRKAEEATRVAEEEQERQRQAAEEALRQAAAEKQEKERLEAQNEKARLEALAREARVALAGLGGPDLTAPDSVDPQHRVPAIVEEDGVTITSRRGSSATGWTGWYATTVHGQGEDGDGMATEHTMVVYSDVGAPKSTPIGDAGYTDEADADTNVFRITVAAAHKTLIRSSQFPTSAGDTKDIDAETSFSGSFDGASGTFSCGVALCIVRNTGNGFLVDEGALTFEAPESRTVKVADEDFMYFGWWRRTNNDGTFSYGRFRDEGIAPVAGTPFTQLEGEATYVGPAIGQYALYEPLSTRSNHGEFKATARLTANFGDTSTEGTLSGSITGFDVSPDWSLSLKQATINNASVTGGNVSWTIDGHTADEEGAWIGDFHSNDNPYDGQRPDGLTGTFTAQFDNDARLVGAYGAHRQ